MSQKKIYLFFDSKKIFQCTPNFESICIFIFTMSVSECDFCSKIFSEGKDFCKCPKCKCPAHKKIPSIILSEKYSRHSPGECPLRSRCAKFVGKIVDFSCLCSACGCGSHRKFIDTVMKSLMKTALKARKMHSVVKKNIETAKSRSENMLKRVQGLEFDVKARDGVVHRLEREKSKIHSQLSDARKEVDLLKRRVKEAEKKRSKESQSLSMKSEISNLKRVVSSERRAVGKMTKLMERVKVVNKREVDELNELVDKLRVESKEKTKKVESQAKQIFHLQVMKMASEQKVVIEKKRLIGNKKCNKYMSELGWKLVRKGNHNIWEHSVHGKFTMSQSPSDRKGHLAVATQLRKSMSN